MKIGILGAGAVGTACAKAMLLRGSCDEIVLLDNEADERAMRRLAGTVADLSHAATLGPATVLGEGTYKDLDDAGLVVVTSGFKESTLPEAIDRGDEQGRLRLLAPNAEIYREIVPLIVERSAAPILVVTDPPDPLADVARAITGPKLQVLSAGTFLDTQRFRLEVGRRLGVHATSVEAMVLGEHGLSQVYAWSAARVGGEPALDLARRLGHDDAAAFRREIERAVRYANIDIIEGTGASQHGIGVVTARIVEAILRDERLVAPVGTLRPEYGVTLSLPSVLGAGGVRRVLRPELSEREWEALAKSARVLGEALRSVGLEPAPAAQGR